MINKKSKVFKFSAFLGAIVFAIALMIMPFLINNKKETVFADSVDTTGYTFNSSNLYLPISLFNSNVTDPNNSANYVETSVCNFRFDITNINGLSVTLNAMYFQAGFPGTASYFTSTFTSSNFSQISSCPLGSFHYCAYVSKHGDFLPNISSVRIYSRAWGGTSTTVIENRLIFYDINSNDITIVLYYKGNINTNSSVLSDRTYYFNNDVSDNAFYQQGFNDGESEGLTTGYSNGYNSGYNNGYSVGERAGFNDGVEHSNDYTFLGLFGAIVDAPLTALFGYVDQNVDSPTYHQRVGGLLNFTLSFDGVHYFDLKGFFLAILAIAIVVAIIRFALSK